MVIAWHCLYPCLSVQCWPAACRLRNIRSHPTCGHLCDFVLLVQAPAFLQQARALARPGMSRERLTAIRGRQMGEPEKCRRADFVVPTGLHRGETLRRLHRVVRLLIGKQGSAFDHA